MPGANPLRRWPGALAALAWFLATSCLVLPVLNGEFQPLVDLPAHMARQYVLSNAGSGPLASYYEYNFSLVPNAAVDALWALLQATGIPLLRFTQLVTVFYLLLFVAAPMVLARVLRGRWRIWPAASALLAYNACFYWGFQNFIVTLPVAVLALALWFALEKQPVWCRALVFLPVAALTMLMHLYAFLGLALAVAGTEVQRICDAPRKQRWPMLLPALLLALPFLLVGGTELVNLLNAPPNLNGGETEYGTLQRRLALPVQIFLPPKWHEEPLVGLTSALAALVSLLAVSSLLASRWLARRPAPWPWLQLEPRLRGAVVWLFFASLLMPRLLNGVYYSDVRLPVILGMLLFGGTEWQQLRRNQALALTLLITGILTLRGVAYDGLSSRYAARIGELQQIARAIPGGARVLAAAGTVPVAKKRLYWHTDAFLVMFAQAYVPTLFQGVHNFRVRAPWLKASVSQTDLVPVSLLGSPGQCAQEEYLRDWSRKYQFLLVVDPGQTNLPASVASTLQQVTRHGENTLYRIVRMESACPHPSVPDPATRRNR